MKYQIRSMVDTDIEAVIAGEINAFGSSLEYDFFYSELHLNPYAYYFVLEIEEEVEGYISLWITNEFADIINFYIEPKYQGLGFGKLLLEFVIDLCKMSKVETISLEVRKTNDKAIALYEKYGFEFSHIRKNYYSDLTDAFVLIKKIEV